MSRTLQAKPTQKYLVERLMEKRARSHEDIIEAVEAFKREQEEYQRSMPTHERMAKGDVKRTIVKGVGIRYEPRTDFLKRFQGKWPQAVEIAFQRIAADAMAREVTNLTMNYNGGGSSRSGHDRAGGISNAHADKIAAGNRFDEVIGTLPGRLQRVISWLILGERMDGRFVSPEDVGRWLFPIYSDKRSCEMLAVGAAGAAGDMLVKGYSDYDIGQKFREIRAPNMRTVNG
jgi:hypothetical protein